MINKNYAKELTQKLIQFNEQADVIYEEVRAAGKEKDFYSEVKPFADEVHTTCSEWKDSMKEWMGMESFTHLFPLQIEQTANNLSDVAVQAFFPKTSYKRFKSHVQSVRYILHNVRDEIDRKLTNL
ncbi:YppE family protein [Peribacillus sp. FSL H8-0477]|uniref:YppE family protein n=1 Tax=Peribacillus sp. FSL H8-0477 TaxID=2921388 RepID=UPI0030F9207B